MNWGLTSTGSSNNAESQFRIKCHDIRPIKLHVRRYYIILFDVGLLCVPCCNHCNDNSNYLLLLQQIVRAAHQSATLTDRRNLKSPRNDG